MRPDSNNVAGTLNDYLEKCHNYYCGNIHYQNKAFLCMDKDYGDGVPEMTLNLLHIYPEVVSIGGPSISITPEQYLNEYVNWYELTEVWFHSDNDEHEFEGGSVTGSEIKSLSGGSRLTIIWGCHAADFHKSPIEGSILATSYVFDNKFGLASIAATRSIGIEDHEAVYYSLGSGKVLGDAFFDWINFVYDKSFIQSLFPSEDINRFMWGFILMGDPFIVTHDEQNFISANEPPIANAGLDQTVYVTPPSTTAQVALDVSGSYDPNNDDPLTYIWTWASNSATGVSPTIELPLGISTVTLVGNDGKVDSEPDTIDITVEQAAIPPTDREALLSNKLGVLAPWLVLIAAIIAAVTIILRRRGSQAKR